MKRILSFVKTETVFVLSGLLALLSCFIVKPSVLYIHYIDFNVLICLFVLMLAVAGLKQSKVLQFLSYQAVKSFQNTRAILFAMIAITFVGSMLLTNDVALITFIPITLIILKETNRTQLLIPAVILQTIAANMGSMATPIGNPQNLYLFSFYNMSLGAFFTAVIPVAVLSLVLLCICCLFIKKDKVYITEKADKPENLPQSVFSVVVLVLAILSVFKLVPSFVTLVAVVGMALFINRKLFREADYILLLTFVFFFVFIGNLTAMPAVHDRIAPLLYKNGSVYTAGVICSQVISNVPAAILLSGFSHNAKELLLGVNIGGNGTIIASLASLISYKLFIKEYPHKSGRYLGLYTLASFAFLIVLYVAGWLLI